jgi:hypothetical protein
MTWIMDSLGLITFLKNSFLLNCIITKIYTSKIMYKPNDGVFVWEWNNLIESKPKQIIKTNSKSIKCKLMKMEAKGNKKTYYKPNLDKEIRK